MEFETQATRETAETVHAAGRARRQLFSRPASITAGARALTVIVEAHYILTTASALRAAGPTGFYFGGFRRREGVPA
jgi:hypothetical protein